MMDSYNLAWKLIHSINGLTPAAAHGQADPVLETFNLERVETARQLIDFDTKFSSMFSGQIGSEHAAVKSLTHEEFLAVFSEGSGFTSGCGLQYAPSLLVDQPAAKDASNGAAHCGLGGLITGKRLLNVEVRRCADANLRQLQDGIYHLLNTVVDPYGHG